MKRLLLYILPLLFLIFDSSIVFSQCTAATATVTTVEPGCDGTSGQIIVNATGGATPYQYGIGGWTTQSSNVFTGLSAGTYNVRIITADNCETWVNNVVLNYTPMEFSGSIVNQTCWDYVAGSINIVPSRGVAPYTYSDDGGNTYTSNNFFQQLDVGTYSYKVKDSMGCVKDVSFTITKSHMDPSVTTTPVQCSGIKGTAVVTFGGSDNYTFSIDNNASIQSGSGTYTYTQLNPGNYLFQCSDINGCTESTTFTVGDENIQSSITNVTHETCNDTNAVFTISTSNGVGPYQYSIDEGLTFTGSDTFTGLDEGEYHTKVIDSRGCESNDTIIITNTGGVEGTINQDTTICNGDVTFLYVSATGQGLSYSWNHGLGNDSLHAVTPAISTQYDVVVSDIYNCTLNLTTNVTVNDYPVLNVSLQQIEMCEGDSIQVFATGATSYLWSTGDTLSATYITSPFGEDSVVIYGYNGQCETPYSIPVTIHSINAAITDSQHICIGGNTTIYVNSVENVTYSWNNNLPPLSYQVVSPQTNTIYTVILTDAYGCKDTLETSVLVDDAVNLSVSPTSVEVCQGEIVQLSATGATTYSWSNDSTGSDINHLADANEVLTLTGYNGECSQNIDIPITVLPRPLVEITANSTSINTNDYIQFGIGASNASSYTWNFGDGFSSNSPIPYHQYIFAGAYNVILTGEKGVCNNSDTLLIYVGVAGINESNDYNFIIYPLPADNIINIKTDKSYPQQAFYLTDLTGKVVSKRFSINSSVISIDISTLSSGVYYLTVEPKDKTKRIIQKVIKQ